jgi:hypothetical protein
MDQANPPTQTAPALTPAREALAKAVQTAADADGRVHEARAAVGRADALVADARARRDEAQQEVSGWQSSRTETFIKSVAEGRAAPAASGLPLAVGRLQAAATELAAAQAAQATFRERLAAAERAAERAQEAISAAVEGVLTDTDEAGRVIAAAHEAGAAYRRALAHLSELRFALDPFRSRSMLSTIDDVLLAPLADEDEAARADTAWRSALERLRVDPEAPLPA